MSDCTVSDRAAQAFYNASASWDINTDYGLRRALAAAAAADRFGALDLAELQQLYAALYHADVDKLFGEGTGNLMPRLREEVGCRLDEALAHESD